MSNPHRRRTVIKQLALLLTLAVGLWGLPDAAAQTVTITNVTSVTEPDSGETNVVFTISMSARPFFTTTITFSICDGTATGGEDYRPFEGLPGQALDDRSHRQVSLRFTRNNWWPKTISVPIYGDTKYERDETLIGCLAGRGVPEGHRGTATIRNNDEPTNRISIADARTEEGDDGVANLDFQVTLSEPTGFIVTVSYATADGTATAGMDYEATSGELLFPPGASELTVSVPVLGDITPEADEAFTLTLDSPNHARLGNTRATGVIANDDTAVVSITDARVDEGDEGAANLDFQVTLSVASDLEVTVPYATADGTATAGADYEATSGELQFAPGETQMTVSVPVLGDITPEADETFTVTLGSPTNAELGEAQATGLIANDDPTVASIADARVDEGDSGTTNLGFQVTLSLASDVEVTVPYATADGTATAGSDYEATSGELSFAPGETQMTVSVPVLGDIMPEADETFTVTLGSPTNAELGEAQATGVIANDDVALASISDAETFEGNGDGDVTSLDFQVTLSAASDLVVTVAYATADGTATAGVDYQATSGELRFAPGETQMTISVPVLGDLTPEDDETLTVTLSSPTNAELGQATATGYILDDDPVETPPATLVFVEAARTDEGDGGTASLDFQVTLSAASDIEVTVAYATADGTATAGSDYEATSGELRFAPGETQMTIPVPVLGDIMPEADETLTVTLSNPTNAELDQATATGVIANDDTALVSIADARIDEGHSGATSLGFQVTLSAASNLEVMVNYATADGTASAGSDYEATSGELRFAPGETQMTVSVPVLGDMTPEADENFTVTLNSPGNAELGTAQATGVIANDDTALASIADASVNEGDAGTASLSFQVTLSVAGDLEVTVPYATADGTANAGSDYEATSGELRFAPGETQMTVSVPVLGDSTPEADETLTVTLSSPGNAALGQTMATGVIVDDDVAQARDRALEASLAGFGRILSHDAMNAISSRFRETPATRDSQVVLGGQRLSQASLGTWHPAGGSVAQASGAMAGDAGGNLFATPMLHGLAEPSVNGAWRNQLSLGDFLQRSSFDLALAQGDDGDDWGLSLWGRASRASFSGEPLSGLSSDGDVMTGYLGMDAKVGERLFAGAALAHSDGDIDYGIADFGGRLNLSLTSVLPYMHYQLNDKLELWSMVGLGWGEGDFRDAAGSGEQARGKLDLAMSMVAVGANRELATWNDVNLALKSDAFTTLIEGDPEGGVAQREVKARAQGIRLMLAGSKELMASARERLDANLEFGGRWDGGDAQTGWGTEIAGGLDYRHADVGLGIAVQGRYLLSHNAQSLEEKGVSLTLELDPGVQGRGFSFALRPAWGAHSMRAGGLWNDDALRLMGGTADQTQPSIASERLDLEWGYGLGLWRGTGLLRLQGAMSHHGMGQKGYRLGGMLDVPGMARVTLELNRQEALGQSNHAFLIRWNMNGW